MSKVIKEVENYFTPDDRVDIRIIKEENRFVGFVLSYRAYIEGGWHEVMRIDTCHDYLHMQKFWRSPKPRELKEYSHFDMKTMFETFWRDLEENWRTYRRNMERRIGGRRSG